MKRAALYARVSSDRQKDDKTIESQIAALKQQIARDGNVLAKEYVDDGWRGALLDRPALDELRADLKGDIFDAVYFHSTDRIAREVVVQHIIIGDILKHGKQIVINGKDYVANPENKFTLTILGAVAELEKAKIIERATRGKRYKIQQGLLVSGFGMTPYGYTYVRKSGTTPAHYEINEEQAAAVRFMFETYAAEEISIFGLAQKLERRQYRTARGGMWDTSNVHRMLTNTGYHGVMYCYRLKRVASPIAKQGKLVKRDRAEWMPVNIPAIVSKALFDRVQGKLEQHRRRFRNRKPSSHYLLTGLVKCGECGHGFSGRLRKHRLRDPNAKFRYYSCNYKQLMRSRLNGGGTGVCSSKAVIGTRLELGVWHAVLSEILNPAALKSHVELLRSRTRERDEEYRQRLVVVEKELKRKETQKQRVLDLYADGRGSKESYFRKMQGLQEEEWKLRAEQVELIKQLPLLGKPALIRKSIEAWCAQLSASLPAIRTFDDKHRFLLDVIDSISFNEDVLKIRGFVPLLAVHPPQNGALQETYPGGHLKFLHLWPGQIPPGATAGALRIVTRNRYPLQDDWQPL